MAVRPDTPTMAMSPQRCQSSEIWPIENTAKEPEIIKGYHTHISVELGVSNECEVFKLKTCSLYHKKLLMQKFNDMITQVLKEFFFQPLTSWRLSEAVSVSIL